jgi:hypothetical protein
LRKSSDAAIAKPAGAAEASTRKSSSRASPGDEELQDVKQTNHQKAYHSRWREYARAERKTN